MKSFVVSVAILQLAAIVTLGIGWVMNFLTVLDAAMNTGDFTPEFTLRLIGIFLMPLGGFLGWM